MFYFLEWCKHKYNCNYRTRNKRFSEKNQKKKLDVLKLELFYNSVLDASEKMNVVKSSISNCLKGRSVTSCGYRWEYV